MFHAKIATSIIGYIEFCIAKIYAAILVLTITAGKGIATLNWIMKLAQSIDHRLILPSG